jgi:hypothetical protein
VGESVERRQDGKRFGPSAALGSLNGVRYRKKAGIAIWTNSCSLVRLAVVELKVEEEQYERRRSVY